MAKGNSEEPGPLERLFGHTATARILDFMHLFREWDYSKMDIAKNSNVSFPHALKEIKKLEKLNLIKKTRNVGRAQMHQYNMENPAAQLLQKFALQLASTEVDLELARQEQEKQAKAETKTAAIPT